jgi:pyruvate kinase
MKKISIFSTIGPGTIDQPNFLKFSNKNLSLLRLNMSHLNLTQLEKYIKKIRMYSKTPICIDTEGAQIRTKIAKKKLIKKGTKIKIHKNKFFHLYPENVYNKLKKNDVLDVGFKGLKIKVFKKNDFFYTCKAIEGGYLEKNAGVKLINRNIKLNYLTEKDLKAIDIGKKNNIRYYALSFTNSVKDIEKFNKILSNQTKIFKIETLSAVKDLFNILKKGENFLIDRGDLSKEIKIENIPSIQRKILKLANKLKKKVFVATNFLESMIKNNYPNRGEVNDIYATLEMGAAGLVLAAETAIGKHPLESVKLLQTIIKTFKKDKFK